MTNYVPHTDEDFARMLADLGLSSTAELFSCIPTALRLAGGLDIPLGMSEPDVASEMARLAGANRAANDLVCFAGAGAYDHDIPAVTRALAGRSEFVTSYTPYQPEVAQGVLQALFEYQTLVSRLAGLPVANASVYDGATATVEAVNLAVAATGRSTVWVSAGLNPRWRRTLATLTAGRSIEVVDIDLVEGRTDWQGTGVHGRGAPGTGAPGQDAKRTDERPAAIVVASPNYLGCIDPLGPARETADRLGALLVAAFDPVAAGLLRTPGEQGADVAVAEGQPLGTPLAFGGPYLGMFAVAARARPAPSWPAGRADRRRQRPDCVRDHAASKGAGYPPRTCLLEHLHQPDPDRSGRHGPAGLARHTGAPRVGVTLCPRDAVRPRRPDCTSRGQAARRSTGSPRVRPSAASPG